MKFNFLKGKANQFSSENRRYHNNLLLFKNKIKAQNQYPVYIPKDIASEKIDKIKMKYSLSQNSINTQFVHRKIQFLKNKYMNNNTQSLDSKFKIILEFRFVIII